MEIPLHKKYLPMRWKVLTFVYGGLRRDKEEKDLEKPWDGEMTSEEKPEFIDTDSEWKPNGSPAPVPLSQSGPHREGSSTFIFCFCVFTSLLRSKVKQ